MLTVEADAGECGCTFGYVVSVCMLQMTTLLS